MKLKKMLLIVFLSLFTMTCAYAKEKTKITVFHAGSLAKPFKDIKTAFEKKHPEVEVLLEAAGSRTCARKITDLNKIADVMASADESVIRTLLMPEYAEYALNFVTNEMAIMFNKNSKYADIINSENWTEILLKKDVEFGHADPNKDPCGYRTLLVWQLAEKYYKEKDLYKKLDEARPKKNIRPKETDLIGLLDAGELDYIFIYRSVAFQHKHPFVTLPNNINLGSFVLKDYYKSAKIEITGKKPGEKITKNGAPMVYGITVPKNAKNKKWGQKFVEFVVSDEGDKIMSKNGHPVLNPAETLEFEILPEKLKMQSKKI
ncbi:MAG: tungstate ABC transporter substrate-binding protein WtpA [Pseudomonadota bacterium]